MTSTLLAVGVIYLLVAAGLRSISRPGCLVLVLGAVALISTALAPQPAHGSSGAYMAGMVIGTLAFVGWPLALASDRGLDPRLRRGSLAATAAMIVVLTPSVHRTSFAGRYLHRPTPAP